MYQSQPFQESSMETLQIAASKEMQDKIWCIARAGGYVPNTSAQALRQKTETSSHHQSIACIYARSQDAQNDAFFSTLTRSIEQEALKEGYYRQILFFRPMIFIPRQPTTRL